ncbi:MAG: terpene cyclase/mutase family protein [Candidatus Brocadiae bacterium]|nr:terpene cyclase/mutase family protein [Candidatus Brocadiia bacterium]
MKKLAVMLALVGLLGCTSETEPKTGAPPKMAATPGKTGREAYAAALQRGAEWLLEQQQDDGTFGGPAEVGKTSLVLAAILDSPHAEKLKDHEGVKKAIAYIVAMVQQDGSINQPGEKGLANYQTSASLTALVKLGDPTHQAIRDKAKEFLLSIQNREAYDGGSWGYNSDKRGDLSNTQFALEALKAAGLDENSEAFKECRKFLTRCQNLSETSDYEHAGDDGGAMYYPGRSNAGVITLPNGKVIYKSYGSMTYALLRGYILTGIKRDDPRVQAAQKWIVENYTLDGNPGMEKGKEHQGLYYYYLSMAKTLPLLGTRTLELPDGSKVDWAKELADKLVALQRDDGSWINEKSERWFEGNPILATPYAMIALSECHKALAP